MPTSSFNKDFKVNKKSVQDFVENMSKDVNPTMNTNFKSKYTNNKKTIKNIVEVIFNK